jgi:hypothetical protein
MGKFILNRETQKIELHFDKSEYLALSEEMKTEIKRFFLWSSKTGAWVSRSTRDHYWARKVAEKLGLEDGGKEGERLSYAEELERKTERAEARAERMETYADNAEKRGISMQAELNSYRGDIAFFTQPNINTSAGRAFKIRRERIFAKYEKGMEEYRKSDYFRGRAETARATADMKQLKNPVYLHNRIKEQNAIIKRLQGSIAAYEDNLNKLQQGETLMSFAGTSMTMEGQEKRIGELLDEMEYELDKLAFFENALEEIGGIQFSRENIKVGFIVHMRRWGRCEILSTGPVNVTFKILDGGASGGVLTEPYTAIGEIIQAKEKTSKIENPYKIGDILYASNIGGNRIIRAFEVIKTTATGVKIQRIAVENNVPQPGKYTGEPMQKKVVKSKYSDFVGAYDGDWQLHKYESKELAGAV